MKLVGDRYLQDTLGEPVRRLLDARSDLEIDPLKLSSPGALYKQRNSLRGVCRGGLGQHPGFLCQLPAVSAASWV